MPAFVHSPLLPKSAWGSVFGGLFHVSDWLPTLAYGLQGRALPSGTYDGVDQWADLMESEGGHFGDGTAGDNTGSGARQFFECGIDYLVRQKGNLVHL